MFPRTVFGGLNLCTDPSPPDSPCIPRISRCCFAHCSHGTLFYQHIALPAHFSNGTLFQHSVSLLLRSQIDHFLEVGMMRPVDTIREYSLLSNPRMPEKVKASIAHVPITGSVGKAKSSVLPGFLSGGSEMARLRNDYRSAKVLNITNLGSMVAGGKFDAARDMLSTVEKAAFMKAFGFASGSWCCAPQADKKKGQPQSGRFRLME